MPRKKARDEAREARTGVYRQHILDAAELVFAERGYEAAKVLEISDRSGLSMGTIYAIFPGKAEQRGILGALTSVYIDYFVSHPDFLRMHLRSGASWALGPVTGSPTQKSYWQEIHELQAGIFQRGVAAGEFVDEDPAYLAKLFSAMDQVLLADWVAGGMRTDRDTLVRRLRDLIDRALCLPASSKRRTAAR